MHTLILDRSTSFPSLAVFNGEALVRSHVWEGEPSRAPGWMADVRDLLDGAGIPLDSITRFVCGVGPGSFSGIRACLAAMNGLALPRGLPVYGIASAAAIAAAQDAESVTVLGDARRNRFWCVTYQKVGQKVGQTFLSVQTDRNVCPTLHSADDFQLVTADELAGAIPEGTRIVSPDWERLAPVLQAAFGGTSRLVENAVYPSAEIIGKIALAEPSAMRLEPSPIYLHPAV